MITNIESKVDEVITRSTLVKETENHVFKITNYEAGKTPQRRIKGTIKHKNGTDCGDFVVNSGVKRMLSVNINMACKDLLADLLTMLNDLDNNNIVEVEEFNYVKELEAAVAAKEAAKAAAMGEATTSTEELVVEA